MTYSTETDREVEFTPSMERIRDEYVAMREDQCGFTDLYAAEFDRALLGDRSANFEAGVRQAMEWLRADYEYGTGPDWREQGVDWIADRLAERRASA